MDLEHFPTNETAKRFLTMVSPIYENSYVGKWIYQVMGIEIGYASDLILGLMNEAFPETATWTLPYWEKMYGILTNNSLTVEQRRKAVLEIRGFKRPMNPARIKQLIQNATNRTVKVHENTAPGCYEVVVMDGESEANLDKIRSIINDVKQSTKHVDIVFETPMTIRIRADPQVPGHNFPYPLSGTKPDVNIPGKLSDICVNAEVTETGSTITYPVAGINNAGTVPDVSIIGKMNKKGLSASVDEISGNAVYKICGASRLQRGG